MGGWYLYWPPIRLDESYVNKDRWSELEMIREIISIFTVFLLLMLLLPIQGLAVNKSQVVCKAGDTLWRISATYGVSVQQIIVANNIVNPNLIYPNQVLKII